jgi:predicted methyltransferase
MIGKGVRRRLARAVASSQYALALAVLLSFAAPRQSDAELQRFHRVDDLLKLLDARPGTLIADIGAGEGFITIPIARAVTPGGRVVAEDIDEKALAKLRSTPTASTSRTSKSFSAPLTIPICRRSWTQP